MAIPHFRRVDRLSSRGSHRHSRRQRKAAQTEMISCWHGSLFLGIDEVRGFFFRLARPNFNSRRRPVLEFRIAFRDQDSFVHVLCENVVIPNLYFPGFVKGDLYPASLCPRNDFSLPDQGLGCDQFPLLFQVTDIRLALPDKFLVPFGRPPGLVVLFVPDEQHELFHGNPLRLYLLFFFTVCFTGFFVDFLTVFLAACFTAFLAGCFGAIALASAEAASSALPEAITSLAFPSISFPVEIN